VLYGFQEGGSTGAFPESGLIFDEHGILYGTTTSAVYNGSATGNVFRMKPPVRKGGSWAFSVLYNFKGVSNGDSDGAYPTGNLIFGKGGGLYGTTLEGGTGQTCGYAGCGTSFEVFP
jgi:hypothetical protein